MNYLLDTSTLSHLIREEPAVLARLASLSPSNRVVTCTIVRGEILQGLHRLADGRKTQRLFQKSLNVLAGFPCQPIAEGVADVYADLKISQEKKGLRLDENDLWIASMARFIGATLVSSDRDFLRIEGLTVEDWTK